MTAIWLLKFVATFVIASAVIGWWRGRRKSAALKAAILQVLKPGAELRMVELWEEVYRTTGIEASLGMLYMVVDDLDANRITCSVFAPFSIGDHRPRTHRFVRRIA